LGAVNSLEFRKPGDFLFASRTPGGPEIEQNHFAPIILELYSLAGTVCERELGSRFARFCLMNSGADCGLARSGGEAGQREKQRSETHQVDSN